MDQSLLVGSGNPLRMTRTSIRSFREFSGTRQIIPCADADVA